jgi:hypothetical protein
VSAESESSRRERISDAFKKAAQGAVDPGRARAAFGQRLVVAGLAMACLAGGIDYFQSADDIRRAATGIARDAGATGVADAADALDRTVEETKQGALARLPDEVRSRFALIALVMGISTLGTGAWIRLRADGDRSRAMRDIGRVVAAPGFLGVFAFVLLTLRSYRLRVSLLSFWDRLWGGGMGVSDLWGLVKHYAPWAWAELWGLCVVGLVFVSVALTCRLIPCDEQSSARPRLRFASRFFFWAGLLALGYYFAATAVAVASYGGALSPFLTWPWKLTPGAVLTSITFMSTGLAMARTGTAGMKRDAASE